MHDIENKRLLCCVEDIIEGGSKGFSLSSSSNIQDIFVVYFKGQFYGYKNTCPHTGIALNWLPDVFLDINNTYIQCAVHGAIFEIETGLCVSGPCVRKCLDVVDVYVFNNQVYV